MLSCKNCRKEFSGKYCPDCGQKYIDQRFTLKDSLYWAFHSIFNLDKGFLYTSRILVTNPGKVINEFLDGITIRYAHPFRFVFIWSTISALLGVYFGTFEDTGLAMNEAMGVSQDQINNSKKATEMMRQYMSFVIMAMIPFLSLGSALLFRKKKMTYAEHLIINSFTQSSSIIIGLPLLITYYFYHDIAVIGYANFLLGAIVYSRVYVQVFKVSWIEAFLKYILGFVITLIAFTIFISIVMIGGVLIMKVLGLPNPFKPA